MTPVCSARGCSRSDIRARELCPAHYQRWQKYGNPNASLRRRRNHAGAVRAVKRDLRWLAGLLEGEGCFSAPKSRGWSPSIQLCMTDRDVVERAAGMMGASVYSYSTKGRPNEKPTWRFNLSGQMAAQWMMTLYVLMGSRRQKAIERALSVWRAN